MDPRRKLQVVSAANPSLRVSAAPKQLSVAPQGNIQLRVANAPQQTQIRMQPGTPRYSAPAPPPEIKRPKQSFWNKARDILDANTQADQYRRQQGNLEKYRLGTANESNIKPIISENPGNIISNTVGAVPRMFNTAANQIVEVGVTAQQQFATNELTRATNELLAAQKSGDKARYEAAKYRVNNASQRVSNINNLIKATKANYTENKGGLFNAGTLYNEQDSYEGKLSTGIRKIGGGTAEGMFDVASFGLTGVSAKQVAKEGFKQTIKQSGKIIAKNAALNTGQGAASSFRQGGDLTDIAISAAASGTIGTGADIALAGGGGFIARQISKLLGNADPFVKQVTKYLTQESSESAIKGILETGFSVPAENVDAIAKYVASETNSKAVDKLVKELSIDPNLELTPDVIQQLRDNGIKSVKRDQNAQYEAQYQDGTITARGQKEFDDNVYHELGHHIYINRLTPEEKALFTGQGNASKQAVGRTGYTQSDVNSEDFSDYLNKAMRGRIGEVPAEYQAVIRKYAGLADDIAATDKVPIGTKITSPQTPTTTKVPVGNFDVNTLRATVKDQATAAKRVADANSEIERLINSGDTSTEALTKIDQLQKTIDNLEIIRNELPTDNVIAQQGIDQVTVGEAGKQLSGVAPQQIDEAVQPTAAGIAPLAADTAPDAVKIADNVSDIAATPPPLTSTNPTGSLISIDPKSPTDALKQEARKYKSAEEFVRAQGSPLYHGSPNHQIIRKEGFKTNPNGNNLLGEGVYLTPHRTRAENYSIPSDLPQGATITQAMRDAGVIEGYTSKRTKIYEPASRAELQNISAKELQDKGYDGVSINGETVIFDSSKVKTREQLTDLYNQAHAEAKAQTPNESTKRPIKPAPAKPLSVVDRVNSINEAPMKDKSLANLTASETNLPTSKNSGNLLSSTTNVKLVDHTGKTYTESEVPVLQLVRRAEFQPRTTKSGIGTENSVFEKGYQEGLVDQPLLVRKNGDKYEVLGGHSRTSGMERRAEAGLPNPESVKARVYEGITDAEARAISRSANQGGQYESTLDMAKSIADSMGEGIPPSVQKQNMVKGFGFEDYDHLWKTVDSNPVLKEKVFHGAISQEDVLAISRQARNKGLDPQKTQAVITGLDRNGKLTKQNAISVIDLLTGKIKAGLMRDSQTGLFGEMESAVNSVDLLAEYAKTSKELVRRRNAVKLASKESGLSASAIKQLETANTRLSKKLDNISDEILKKHNARVTSAAPTAPVDQPTIAGMQPAPAAVTPEPPAKPVYNKTNADGRIVTSDGRTAEDMVAQARQQEQGFVEDIRAITAENNAIPNEKFYENAVKKDMNRIVDKIVAKDGRPPTDILRSTLIVTDPNGSIDNIMRSFENRGYTVWMDDITNRYTDGTVGYKDIAIKYVKGADDPVVKEIQVMTPNMADAKNVKGGHALYKQIENAPRITQQDLAEIGRLYDKMNALYAEADVLDAAAIKAASVEGDPSIMALAGADSAPEAVTAPISPSGNANTLTTSPSMVKNSGNLLNRSVIGDPLSTNSISKNTPDVKNISERGFAKSLAQTDTPPEVYENLLGYSRKPNPATFENAARSIEADEQGVLKNVLSKPTNALTDDETAQALLLLDKAIKNDQLELAEQIAGKINVSGTENGRAVQILSAIKKTTPEGAYLEAQKIITEAQEKGLLPKDYTIPKETVDNIQAQAEYIQQVKQYNTELENYAKTIDENSSEYDDVLSELAQTNREYELSVAGLGKTLKDIVPPTIGDKLNSIVNISLLLNPKTFVRNVIGNTANAVGETVSGTIASPLDVLASLRTGNRTVALPNILKRLGGFGRGLKEGAVETERGVRIGGGGKYDINPAVFKNRAMARIEKTLGHSLSDMDKAFATAQFDETLDSLMRASGVKKPTQEMLDIAQNEALYATFQHDSFIAKSLQGVKKFLNQANIKGFGLGDVVVRYPKTPGNLVSVGMDYSPYGFFKGLVQFAKLNEKSGLAAQRAAVRNLGRGITGTGLITGGYVLAQNGIITANKDSDKDVASLQRNQGQPPFSFNMSALNRFIRGEDTKAQPGDVISTYDWLQPNAIQLSMGANMALNKDKGNADMISTMLDQAATGLETIEEQPVLKQTGTFFKTATTAADRGGGIPNAIADAVVGVPSMFVPTALNQAAGAIDNTARTTYDPNPIKQATNKVVAKLPFANQSLEPVVDTLGNEVKRQQTDNPVTRVFNSFINPAFVTKLKQTPEGQMVLDIYDRTGEKGQFPRVTDRKMTINGESYSLSPKEITEFQKYTGKETEKAFAELANNPSFMNASDEEKIKIMSGIVTDVSSAARIKILGNDPKTVNNDVKAILNGKAAGFSSKIPDGVSKSAQKYYEKTAYMDQESYDAWLKGAPDQIATDVAGELNGKRPANTNELTAYNGLAKRYAEYEKSKAEAKADGSWTKLDEKEKDQEFWKGAIKDGKDDLTKDIYDAGSSGSKDYWEQGLISKEDISKAIALDDELYSSGLSKSLKFSKTFRRQYGYGVPTAPGEKASGSGGGKGGGGGSSKVKKTGVNELRLRYTPDAAPTISRVPRNVQLKLTKPAPVQVTPVRIRL